MKLKTRIIAAALIFMSVVFLFSSLYISNKNQNLTLQLQLRIVEQEQLLGRLADITDRNGADAVVEKIIKDCSLEERVRFDTLLDNLATLNKVGLAEIDILFGSCAGFFAERKAVMVSRFEREYEVYKDFVTLLSTLDSRSDTIVYPLDDWKRLVDMELERSAFLTEQVVLQKSIITALQNGERVQSEGIQEMSLRAQDIAGTNNVLNIQIDVLRNTLLDV